MKQSSLHGLLSMGMEFIFSSPFLLATSLLLILISYISSNIFRINKGDSLKKDDRERLMTKEIRETNYLDSDTRENREEWSDFTFKFQYQIANRPETEEEIQSPLAATVNNYKFVRDKDVSGFVREPEIQVFRVDESCLDSEIPLSYEKESRNNQVDDVVVKTVEQPSLTVVNKAPSCEILEEEIGLNDLAENSWGEIKRQTLATFLSEELSSLNSDSESVCLSDGYSVKDLIVDSDGILSDDDANELGVVFEESAISSRHKLDLKMPPDSEEPEAHVKENEEFAQKGTILVRGEAEVHGFNPKISIELIDSSDDELLLSARDKFSSRENPDKIPTEEEEDLVDLTNSPEIFDLNKEQSATELISTSDDHHLQPMNLSLNKASEKSELLQLNRPEPEADEAEEMAENSDVMSQTNHVKSTDSDEQLDDDEFDAMWEHEDLIEQLKMEIKKTRTNGLPTILEESESVKSDDDPKPPKIDENFVRDDPFTELHKLYKSYIDRMKRLDILNYQKMYSTGFLQVKDPLELLDTQKFCAPSITSFMLQNCPLRRKASNVPSEKFVKELRCELELLYVAQMCLSWEFLRWQYEKARDLLEFDSDKNRHYNEVAGEFQRFQVAIQRFIENETFQGPRVQNYVKNRCILRNLLQVPVVKEDSLKDGKEENRKDNFAVTSEMLEDIMEESIRIFWEFVKGDKDETPSLLKSIMGPNAELQNPSDNELFKEIQSDLQKKEKKLGDILRTGNCLVKKFKKPKEDRSNQDIFFSQIDLKLVARVLRMPRITSEQLHWCRKKLSKISIVERKIQREASFFLFPC